MRKLLRILVLGLLCFVVSASTTFADGVTYAVDRTYGPGLGVLRPPLTNSSLESVRINLRYSSSLGNRLLLHRLRNYRSEIEALLREHKSDPDFSDINLDEE